MNAYERALVSDQALAGLSNIYTPAVRADEDNEGLSMGLCLITAAYYLQTKSLGLASLADCVAPNGCVDSGTMAGAATFLAVAAMNPTNLGEVVAACLRLVKSNKLMNRLGVSFQVRRLKNGYNLIVRAAGKDFAGTQVSTHIASICTPGTGGQCDAWEMAMRVSYQAVYASGLDGIENYQSERVAWQNRMRSVPKEIWQRLFTNPQVGNSALPDLETFDEQNRWGDILTSVQHSR